MLQQSTRVSSFAVNGNFVFEPVVPTVAAKTWFCAANGIRISERLRPGGAMREYVASRPHPNGSGTQWLARRDHIRTFIAPIAAARAAVFEWS